MNLDKFVTEYEKQLTFAIMKYPNEYTYPVADVPVVVSRMRNAFVNKTYNKDGRAIKATCKSLGIKYTYKGINDYIQTLQVMSSAQTAT